MHGKGKGKARAESEDKDKERDDVSSSFKRYGINANNVLAVHALRIF